MAALREDIAQTELFKTHWDVLPWFIAFKMKSTSHNFPFCCSLLPSICQYGNTHSLPFSQHHFVTPSARTYRSSIVDKVHPRVDSHNRLDLPSMSNFYAIFQSNNHHLDDVNSSLDIMFQSLWNIVSCFAIYTEVVIITVQYHQWYSAGILSSGWNLLSAGAQEHKKLYRIIRSGILEIL